MRRCLVGMNITKFALKGTDGVCDSLADGAVACWRACHVVFVQACHPTSVVRLTGSFLEWTRKVRCASIGELSEAMDVPAGAHCIRRSHRRFHALVGCAKGDAPVQVRACAIRVNGGYARRRFIVDGEWTVSSLMAITVEKSGVRNNVITIT